MLLLQHINIVGNDRVSRVGGYKTMENKMFCYQCQETARNTGCTIQGVGLICCYYTVKKRRQES